MSDETDQEEMIREETDAARSRLLIAGALELPGKQESAREQLRASASALCELDPGFAFLPKSEELGYGEEPKILIEKVTALPEVESDSEPAKGIIKEKAFSRPIFGTLTEYPFR